MDSSQKRKSMESETDNTSKKKKSFSNEKDDEKTHICDYCVYRNETSQKEPKEIMYHINNMSIEFKEYVTKFITVHKYPELGPGLLKEDSDICNTCYQVIKRKFSAYERDAEFTPNKKIKPIPIRTVQEKATNKCAICKQNASTSDNNPKFRKIKPILKHILEQLDCAEIRIESSLETMVHDVCYNHIRMSNINKAKQKSSKTPEVIAKEKAINCVLEFAKKNLLVDKKPLIFKTGFDLFKNELYDALNDPTADLDSCDELNRKYFRYHLHKWIDENGIKTDKISASTMYYHSETNFCKLYHEELANGANKSPQSTTSESILKTPAVSLLSSETTILHNTVQILKTQMEAASKICDIYGRYPELSSSFKIKDFIFGKPIRIKTVENRYERTIIPPFPPAIWNFFVCMCAPLNSSIEKKFKMGEIGFLDPFYDANLEAEFYSSVINIISTLLHLFKENNIYPWPMLMAEVLHHPSKAKKVDMFGKLGVIASTRSYLRHKEAIAVLNQENFEQGQPFGFVEGCHLSVHVDNKEFFVKHGVKTKMHQYLAVAAIQPAPSDPSMHLPETAYSSTPSHLQETILTDFDTVEYSAMFPDQPIINEEKIIDLPSVESSIEVSITKDLYQMEATTSTMASSEEIDISTSNIEVHLEVQQAITLSVEGSKHLKVPTIEARYARPRSDKIDLRHQNISEYSLPDQPVVHIRSEYQHQLSDFVIESTKDKENEEKYLSLSFVHADLRNLGSEQCKDGQWKQIIHSFKDHL